MKTMKKYITTTAFGAFICLSVFGTVSEDRLKDLKRLVRIDGVRDYEKGTRTNKKQILHIEFSSEEEGVEAVGDGRLEAQQRQGQLLDPGDVTAHEVPQQHPRRHDRDEQPGDDLPDPILAPSTHLEVLPQLLPSLGAPLFGGSRLVVSNRVHRSAPFYKRRS